MPEAVFIRNGEAVALADVPCLDLQQFRQQLISGVQAGARLGALFGHALPPQRLTLVGVLAHDDEGSLSVCTTEVGETYPAITPECSQAHWFEREIAEQWGIRPQGHPWLKPIRFHMPARTVAANQHGGNGRQPLVGVTEFFRVRGPEVHEVAVGPVHAGIIEPGHFRFLCHGEHVLHLEISLGYQHRGVERALVGGPHKRSVHHMETLAGDTTIAHATAYCEALEGLAGCQVSARAQVLRSVALELERLANHTGDLGALAGDVAYLPTSAYCGRLRGDFLNMTAQLCGSRFGRGFVRPGGVSFDVDAPRVAEIQERLERALADVTEAVTLLWEAPSVQARFENTGTLSREVCAALGLVGPVARACGVDRDVRRDFPSGAFRFAHLPVPTWHTGDVFARGYVRRLEIQRSADFVRDTLANLPEGPVRTSFDALAQNHLVVSLAEAWRGEICHVGITGAHGKFARYKIVDPSFRNWMGLAMALRGQEISDFPLCNKSFNLSYCGHDL